MDRDRAEKQIKHFDERSINYFKARNQKKNIYYRKILFAYCLKGIEFEKKRFYVLEPMCGFGTGKKIMDEIYGKERVIYSGFDACSEIIDIAQKLNPYADFRVGDVLDMTDKKKWDVLIVLGGVHHVPAYAPEVFEKFYEALVPGGILINFEPTYNNVFTKLVTKGIYHKSSSFENETERRFSLNELNFMYKVAGFKIKKQLYPGLLSYLLWYNPQIFKWFNVGNMKLIRKVFTKECFLYSQRFGRKWSAATFSVLQKPIK